MEVISGVNNPRVKAAAELKQKKYREEKGLFLVEGLRAVEEAVAYGDVVSLFVISGEESERQKKVLQQAAEKGVALYQADDKIMHKICDTKTPQGVVAVVRMPKNDISRLNPSRKNMKTIFRSLFWTGSGTPGIWVQLSARRMQWVRWA